MRKNDNSLWRARLRWLGTTRGRLLVGFCFVILSLLGAGGFVAFSIWIENRFPANDEHRALLPASQRAVTRPVVNALSRQIERHVRHKAEAVLLNESIALDEVIARFLDERVPLAERRVYAYRLVHDGSPRAIAALLKVFQAAPPEHKAFIAQLIGSSGNPAAKEWLWPLLNDGHEQVVSAAIQGLAALGGDDAAVRIAKILADSQVSDSIRIAAALGLGTMETPAARDALVDALDQKPPGELNTQILDSLGHFDFHMVADTFAQYLSSPETPAALRVTAVEALANSSAEAVPFLIGLVANDINPEVRASSAWAISGQDAVHDLGPELVDLVQREPAVDVRRRLYEALLPQVGIPAEQLLPLVQAEQDLAARVAGFNAIARATNQQLRSDLLSTFDQEIVPELSQIATGSNSLNLQMRAVFALRRARSQAAQTALAQIAGSAIPQVAAAARNGLRAPNI